MRLPNVEQAVVSPSKIVGYLLSAENSGGKSSFFARSGFSVAEWKVLAQSIYEHASRHEVARVIVTEHGTKYLVEGSIVTPDERYPFVRTVWLIETGTEVPRFITAYPIKERSE